jgi:cytoskeleton protein RodZ
MTSIGETLRRERLRCGLTLPDVARETRISLHLLEAVEADQFDRLPGGVFARSFVRQYARLLGLDEEEIIAAFRRQFEEPAETSPAPEPPPRSEHLPYLPSLKDVVERLRSDSSLSALVWLVVVVLACAGVYSLWQKSRRSPAGIHVAAASRGPVQRAAKQVSLSPAAPATPAPAPKTDFRRAVVTDTGIIKPPPAPAQRAEPAGPGADSETSIFRAAMRVAFTATEPVWVSIKADGTRTYTGTLEVQQSRQFDASRKMTVLVGNAGGLEISLNGKPIGPIGPRGEIRLLQLTPAGAHVLSRTPPTPPPTPEDSTAPAAGVERP